MMVLFAGILMSFSGLVVFSLKRKHLLLMLLSLEFIVLSLYLLIYFYLSGYNYEYFFSLIFISMSVCEGSLGLVILVSMIRCFGNDFILSLTSLW
nr:NADH dehydrogenase subunit 4L [Sarmydus sp. N117]